MHSTYIHYFFFLSDTTIDPQDVTIVLLYKYSCNTRLLVSVKMYLLMIWVNLHMMNKIIMHMMLCEKYEVCLYGIYMKAKKNVTIVLALPYNQ